MRIHMPFDMCFPAKHLSTATLETGELCGHRCLLAGGGTIKPTAVGEPVAGKCAALGKTGAARGAVVRALARVRALVGAERRRLAETYR